MSVDANTGNAFLDSYARQINRLEKDPNATPEYDAALEKQFAAVKAQVLGDGGTRAGPRELPFGASEVLNPFRSAWFFVKRPGKGRSLQW